MFGFLICLWILLWGNCLGRFEAENSLKLTSPESLKGVYECSIISNFGVPQYGETLVGAVIYPKANQRACWDFDDFEIFFRSRQGGLPTYLLVDSGGCFFTLKALYAQKAGAAALLITDNWNEPLIALDSPGEEYYASAEYLEEITIPSARITKSLGDSIKKALTRGEMVTMNLEWRESPGHHDHERVEYEFWTHREYGCGPSCDSNIEFVKKFKGTAQILEQKGYTKFTPHYMAWHSCEVVFSRRQCKSMCINHGRYCAMDPPEVFSKEYYGKDVVVQKLRQACLFKVANERGKPWLWWDYVMHFGTHCRMEEQKYTKECADEVIRSLGVDLNEVDKCIGDTEADVENPLLEAENDAWIDKQSSGGIRLIGPSTLVINNKEYRGKLDKEAVLKAICESFQETADQTNCLSEGLGSYEVDLKEQKATVKSSVQPEAVLQTVSKTGQKTAPSEKQELRLNLWQSLRKLLPQINPFPVYSQD